MCCRQMVSRPVFAEAFWKCYNTLKDTATPEAGMPGYFRFLTLLSEFITPCLCSCGLFCIVLNCNWNAVSFWRLATRHMRVNSWLDHLQFSTTEHSTL